MPLNVVLDNSMIPHGLERNNPFIQFFGVVFFFFSFLRQPQSANIPSEKIIFKEKDFLLLAGEKCIIYILYYERNHKYTFFCSIFIPNI